jgi:hypothetical protein
MCIPVENRQPLINDAQFKDSGRHDGGVLSKKNTGSCDCHAVILKFYVQFFSGSFTR